MGHGHGFVTVFPAQLAKPVVPQAAGGHLDADALPGGKGLGFKAPDVEGNAVLVGPFLYEGLIAVAFFSPQAEVAVRNGERPAFQTDLFCQAHGIDASADCNE